MTLLAEISVSVMMLFFPFLAYFSILLKISGKRLNPKVIPVILTISPHFFSLVFYYLILIFPQNDKAVLMGVNTIIHLFVLISGSLRQTYNYSMDALKAIYLISRRILRHTKLIEIRAPKITALYIFISLIALKVFQMSYTATNAMLIIIVCIQIGRNFNTRHFIFVGVLLSLCLSFIVLLQVKSSLILPLFLLPYLELRKTPLALMRRYSYLLMTIPALIIIGYCFKYSTYISKSTLWGSSDVFEYAALGKYLAVGAYDSVFDKTFIYDGSILLKNFFHSPSYSLQFSINILLHKILNLNLLSFAYVKLLGFFQSLMILTLFVVSAWRQKKILIITTWAFLSSPLLVVSFTNLEIDSYRIAALTASVFMLRIFWDDKCSIHLILLSTATGLAAFSHTMGALSLLPFPLVLFYFFLKKFINARSLISGLIILFFFGYFHYFYDFFWGSGWIKNIL